MAVFKAISFQQASLRKGGASRRKGGLEHGALVAKNRFLINLLQISKPIQSTKGLLEARFSSKHQSWAMVGLGLPIGKKRFDTRAYLWKMFSCCVTKWLIPTTTLSLSEGIPLVNATSPGESRLYAPQMIYMGAIGCHFVRVPFSDGFSKKPKEKPPFLGPQKWQESFVGETF